MSHDGTEGGPVNPAAPDEPTGESAAATTTQLPAASDDGGDKAGGRSRKPLWIALAVVGVILGVYVIGVLLTAGGVPSGTTVVGVNIGGQSEEEAAATLEANLAETAAAPIELSARQAATMWDPATVSMSPDYRETADIASGPIFNPARLFKHLTGQTVEVAPIIRVDRDLLAEQMQALAISSDAPPTEPIIAFEGTTPTLTPGVNGEGIDQAAASDLIVERYLYTTQMALPVTTLEPAVSDEEAERVRSEYALPAVSGPVIVTTNDVSDTLEPDGIASSLSFSPVEDTLEPQLNPEVLRTFLPEMASQETPGKNATWDVSSGKPVVIPSSPGRGVPDEELSEKIIPVLPEPLPADRQAIMVVQEKEPELSTEDAQALNITEKLSSYSQTFQYAEYRLVNVGKAAEYMDGTVLLPGDVYSMNETIKERTVANGYTSGTFISGGRFEEGLGGGVSIATTATWGAAFFAGLEAIEVRPHSLYISRYQPGLEATVAWGYIDLKFRNNTGNGVLITTQSSGTGITVTMWGTKVYDKIYDESSERYNSVPYQTVYDTAKGCAAQGGSNGFTIDVYRIFENGGRVVEREKFVTRYDPTNRIVCGPEPGQEPAPQPDPADSQEPDPDQSADAPAEGDDPGGASVEEIPVEPPGES